MCETGPLLWRLIRIRIRITWEPQPLLAHLNFTLATNGNFSSLFGVIIMKSESFSVVAAVCCPAAPPPPPLCTAFKIGFAALCHCRRRRIAAGRSVQRCCYSNPFGIWSIRLSCCCLQSLSPSLTAIATNIIQCRGALTARNPTRPTDGRDGMWSECFVLCQVHSCLIE